TPLLTALSSLTEAIRRAVCAESASPEAAAKRNLRIHVFSSLLTALLRSVALRLVLIRFSWDLMFATGGSFWVGRMCRRRAAEGLGTGVGHPVVAPLWNRSAPVG